MVHEKRQFERLDVFHVIEIKSHSPLLGLIRNFSYQGLTFELDSIDFEQKENIEFKLKYPQGDLIVSFFGDVVWERREANTFSAGIKLRELDKERKDRLLEILCAIGEVPVDSLTVSKNSVTLKPDTEDKLEEKSKDKWTSETAEHYKRKLDPIFIIALYLVISLIGIIALKEVIIPVSKTDYQTSSNEHVPEPEHMLREPVNEQSMSADPDKEILSNKDNESEHTNNEDRSALSPDTPIASENESKEKLKVDDQYASRLVYTIQIGSSVKIQDVQKQFNYLLRSLNENNRDFLRIEKVGKYYTVRLGRFENYETAQTFLQEMPLQLSEAIILKAHIKNERIIRL